MDFRPTDLEENFRREVHDWLVANLPDGWGTPSYKKPEDPAEKVAFGRQWQRPALIWFDTERLRRQPLPRAPISLTPP